VVLVVGQLRLPVDSRQHRVLEGSVDTNTLTLPTLKEMSDDEGAARASAGQDRQHTPLFDLTPASGDSNRERTPQRGQGAHATRAPLLSTQPGNREDIRTERRYEAPTQRNAEPYVGKEHRPHKTTGDILRPTYGTTQRDRFTAGSATYRPTYVGDYGNALPMRPGQLRRTTRPAHTHAPEPTERPKQNNPSHPMGHASMFTQLTNRLH